MTPKFYGFLWMVYVATAGILVLGGVFTMLVGVAYGFAAFGMIFMGMMCVLPGAVSDHPERSIKCGAAIGAPEQAHRRSNFSAVRSA